MGPPDTSFLFLLDDGAVDPVQDVVETSCDLRYRDGMYPIAPGFQPSLAPHVICPAGIVVVSWSVDLDDQARSGAIEIDDVGPDRVLAAEFPAINATAANPRPNEELSRIHRGTHTSR